MIDDGLIADAPRPSRERPAVPEIFGDAILSVLSFHLRCPWLELAIISWRSKLKEAIYSMEPRGRTIWVRPSGRPRDESSPRLSFRALSSSLKRRPLRDDPRPSLQYQYTAPLSVTYQDGCMHARLMVHLDCDQCPMISARRRVTIARTDDPIRRH